MKANTSPTPVELEQRVKDMQTYVEQTMMREMEAQTAKDESDRALKALQDKLESQTEKMQEFNSEYVDHVNSIRRKI